MQQDQHINTKYENIKPAQKHSFFEIRAHLEDVLLKLSMFKKLILHKIRTLIMIHLSCIIYLAVSVEIRNLVIPSIPNFKIIMFCSNCLLSSIRIYILPLLIQPIHYLLENKNL